MFRTKFLYAIMLVIMVACYYDKEELLYPGSGNCTLPTTLSFSVDVMPILANRCNSCHSGSVPSGGILLTSYTEVMKYVNNGKLMGSINWTSGFVPMPQNASKIPSCEIQKIQTWIDQGAINN